ncbi:MAG: sel1 repeat family protein, partial [Burkholderiaceae bacterium]|nr:sel1 repeat family protein [Burkholderiaceae bacterium]
AYWYERAAEQGDEAASYILASLYENGDGVARDLARARYWYGQAAARGDRAAALKARELGRKLEAD